MSIRFACLLGILLCNLGFAAELTSKNPNPSEIRIIPVRPTPEPDNVITTITFPKEGQVVYGTPIELQFQLQGFPVGVNSDFDRAKELFNEQEGQSLRVFIDNYPPLDIYNSFTDSLDQNNLFFNFTLNKKIPYRLDRGMHVIRAFPVRSFGESLKRLGNFADRIFYLGARKNNLKAYLHKPFLTYNEPLESVRYRANRPILLDFYLTNIQLSKDGYKVKVEINGDVIRILTMWIPYYIYGLERGKHTIRLQLLDEKNQVEPGIFNSVEKTIIVD